MSHPGLRLRHLVFHGPHRSAAGLEFGAGLNVLYGASEVGKSFTIDAIDFMLGGKPPLRDLPERVGYDRIYLGVETLGGEQFTLSRSVEGGAFLAFEGLHQSEPPEGTAKVELAEREQSCWWWRCMMPGRRRVGWVEAYGGPLREQIHVHLPSRPGTRPRARSTLPLQAPHVMPRMSSSQDSSSPPSET